MKKKNEKENEQTKMVSRCYLINNGCDAILFNENQNQLWN